MKGLAGADGIIFAMFVAIEGIIRLLREIGRGKHGGVILAPP